jgi:hypothetical protein
MIVLKHQACAHQATPGCHLFAFTRSSAELCTQHVSARCGWQASTCTPMLRCTHASSSSAASNLMPTSDHLLHRRRSSSLAALSLQPASSTDASGLA